MTAAFPFLTTYDPPATSEGTLDPLGLYQISEQLAVQLVPAVRERMQRIRFLTAIAVGALVTEEIDDTPPHRDASPYLVWEWLVVEAMMRRNGTEDLWGVPGTLVAKRALVQHGYLDARSYLKTPRIFGFHGIYKRLALHLGLVDVHLASGTNAEALVDAWARGLPSGTESARALIERWRAAIRRGMTEDPPSTRHGLKGDAWTELAEAFLPDGTCRVREKRLLSDLLLAGDERRLGALSTIWEVQAGLDEDDFSEEALHARLEKKAPEYGPLLAAIRAYESFARSLQDAFDVLLAEGARLETQGFTVTGIAGDADFKASAKGLSNRFEAVYRALAGTGLASLPMQNTFIERFRAFGEPMDAGACALALCAHHEAIQKAKSAAGKRPWFDRLAPDRIYVRHAYREKRREIKPGTYVNGYRGFPIRRFYQDLQ